MVMYTLPCPACLYLVLFQVDPVKTAGDVEHLGIVGILVLGIIVLSLALYKGWLVTGGQLKGTVQQYEDRLKDVTAQRDRLLNLALKTTDIAKEATKEAQASRAGPREPRAPRAGDARREA